MKKNKNKEVSLMLSFIFAMLDKEAEDNPLAISSKQLLEGVDPLKYVIEKLNEKGK